MKIGFIGLGNMGSGMALNLVKAKHDVHIYDLNKDIVDGLTKKGCIGCSDIINTVKDRDVIITMLPEG